MISFVRGSTNYLRALLQYENGDPVTGATVTGTISDANGDPLLGLANAPLLPIADRITYNYQLTVHPDQMAVREGILYSVEVVATLGDSVIRKRDILQVQE